MPLIKLPTGDWVDPSAVRLVEPYLPDDDSVEPVVTVSLDDGTEGWKKVEIDPELDCPYEYADWLAAKINAALVAPRAVAPPEPLVLGHAAVFPAADAGRSQDPNHRD